MSVHTTGTSGLADTMKTFYQTALLQEAEPALLHAAFGIEGRVMPGNGKVVQFRRFASLATKTGTLTEGVTPNPDDLSLTKIEATLEQVGAFVRMSDMLLLTAYDPMLAETARLQGRQAGRTYDYRIREVLNAGTAVRYAGGQTERTAITASHILTMPDVKKAVRALERNDAMRFPEAGNRFVGLIHPSTKYDLTADTAWTTQVNANNNNGADADARFAGYYVGDAYGVRWYETSHAGVFAGGGSGGADVYSTVILGQGAYGISVLQDLEYIVKPLGYGDDPLNQRASAGWKGSFVSKILNDEFMVRIEHGVTA